MIPRANITAWRTVAPWPDNTQVEQDLVISRALVSMYEHPIVAKQAVFRGGTALHKLFFDPAGRYSEDIDLVQLVAGPIGELVNGIRDRLDPWLGKPKWKQGRGRFPLIYHFETTFAPVVRMRLKVEINTREHFSVLGIRKHELAIENPWFTGRSEITTYELSELLGTKLRALYQRKKGRDLFDLWLGLTEASVELDDVVRCFSKYMEFGKTSASRAQFEANMAAKLNDPMFVEDMAPLQRPGLEYDVQSAWKLVHERLIYRLPGDPWKGRSDSDG